MERQPKALSTEALPESLLEEIFYHVDGPQAIRVQGRGPSAAAAAAALPLVCRRWHHVFNSSQLKWWTLTLDPAALQRRLQALPEGEQAAALAALLRLLQLRGRAARRLWLHSDAPRYLPLPCLLGLMSPGLQQVFIGQGCHDALPLLLRFAGLRSLDLPAAAYAHIDWSAPSAARLLTGFTGLRELTLRDGGITDGLLAVVGQLRGLKLLSISTPDPLPRAFHNEVGKLQCLEELDLYLTPATPHQPVELLPAALRALSRLRTLYVIAPQSLSECLVIGPGLAELPALQDLRIHCRAEALPADLWSCGQLTRLDLELKQHSAGSVAPPAAVAMPQLRDLRLAKCRFPGSTLPPAFCGLAGLTRLAVTHCWLKSEAGAPGLPPTFSALTQLASLSLEGNGLSAVPPGLAGSSGSLRVLDLSCNALASLPPGPYLERLEMLSLSANRLPRLPPALAQARACEVLDLSQNPALELSRADAEGVLLRMPCLGLLLLGKWPGCTATMDWRTDTVASLVWLAQRRPDLEIDFDHTAAEYENLPLST